MTEIICLDNRYSTTKLLSREKPVLSKNIDDTFETTLFLAENSERKAEGGLRAQGYFKKSYDEKPLISIITVVFNGEEYIKETIQSVINQSYDNVEYIIIDGGSTDNTLDIVKNYDDKIDYWVSEKDNGIYDAMNKGIILVTGDWINFMNAGDKLLFLDVNSFLKFTTTHTSYYYHEEKLKIQRDAFTKLYLTHNTPCHQSLFYTKSEIVLFDVKYPVVADFEQMTRICNPDLKPSYGEHIVFFARAGFSSEYITNKNWKKLFERTKILWRNFGLVYGVIAFLHTVRVWVRWKLK